MLEPALLRRKKKSMTNYKKLIISIIVFLLFTVVGFFVLYKKSCPLKDKKFDIAKWQFDITLNGNKDKKVNVNLINESNMEHLVYGKIAPGTTGSFNIEIETTKSDVDIEYQVLFDEKNKKPQNLQFMYNGETKNSLKDLEESLNGIIEKNISEKQIEIFWEWKLETGSSYEEKKINNIQDTKDGIELEKYNFDIIVVGDQVKI